MAFKPAREARLQQYAALGYGHLPVCIAKTQYSFTDDAKVMGAPSGWTLTITDATLSAGAGFVVAMAGNMMLMPGLGKVPQAQKLDVTEPGNRGHGVLGRGWGLGSRGSGGTRVGGLHACQSVDTSGVIAASGQRSCFPGTRTLVPETAMEC